MTKLEPHKFDTLLRAMLTKNPRPVGKTGAKPPASTQDASAGYAGTRTREDKTASVSSKRKYKSPQ